jgi:SAM-dependent methyltransferase
MKDNSDKSWEKLGQHDPYFGVWSADKFKQKNLTPKLKHEFFQSGEKHVQSILDSTIRYFGDNVFEQQSLLDFGCGVGRLVIPFSRKFHKVLGIDISSAMIEEAKKNTAEQNISNAHFLKQKDDQLSNVSEQFDFVHTTLVLQHIPPSRGNILIAHLLNLVKPGGIIVMDVNLDCRDSWFRQSVNFVRRNFIPFQYVVNILNGNPWNQPFMQMNVYDLNTIMLMVVEKGFSKISIEPFYQGGKRQHPGIFLFAKKDEK